MRRMTAITCPTLILNEAIARRNIARMVGKAAASGVRLRPHAKTHQSAAVAAWFRDAGVDALTVSSVGMAAYFADHGWDDLLVAFPLNWREMDAINALAARIRLGLLVESPESAAFLAAQLRHPADVWLEVDTGYGRTGTPWEDVERACAIAAALAAPGSRARLRGLLVHSGHTYRAGSPDAIRAIWAETLARLVDLRAALAAAGHAGLLLAPGDSPACALVDDFRPADEVRPGVFTFFDMQQTRLGACTLADIAIALAAPVVARYPARGQVVVYGGAVHLSKDSYTDVDGAVAYGQVMRHDAASGWGQVDAGSRVVALSQEHGTVQASPALLASAAVGDLLLILPAHACLTAACMRGYRTTAGQPIDMWDGR
jgi:D-serine deaminase-like pyridoxal phosphate-dependent protein